jgi:plastocyanin
MRKVLAAALLGLLVATACTKRRDPPTAPGPPPPSGSTMTIRMLNGNVFVPRDTAVAHGDTVLWINASGMVHTSTSGPCAPCAPDGLWDSGNVGPAAEFRVVFGPGADQAGIVHVDSSGLFPYYCIPHRFQNMAGSITVTP